MKLIHLVEAKYAGANQFEDLALYWVTFAGDGRGTQTEGWVTENTYMWGGDGFDDEDDDDYDDFGSQYYGAHVIGPAHEIEDVFGGDDDNTNIGAEHLANASERDSDFWDYVEDLPYDVRKHFGLPVEQAEADEADKKDAYILKSRKWIISRGIDSFDHIDFQWARKRAMTIAKKPKPEDRHGAGYDWRNATNYVKHWKALRAYYRDVKKLCERYLKATSLVAAARASNEYQDLGPKIADEFGLDYGDFLSAKRGLEEPYERLGYEFPVGWGTAGYEAGYSLHFGDGDYELENHLKRAKKAKPYS
jgi:hypothetical protein